jgi:aspartate aminotransferase-like enzyme
MREQHLNAMKQRLLTPGPTPVPEETLLELARPVFFHRSPEFRSLLHAVVADLQYVFQTTNVVCVLTASGTGGMEAAITSALAPGDKAILLTAGRWGERWRSLGKTFGLNVVAIEALEGSAVPPEQLEKALASHPDAAAVLTTFSETSTGVRHDIEAFGRIVAKTNALFIVDAISGLGVMECRTDAWGIDINVTGSQKALMLPPGLAYVSVSDKAWSKIDKTPSRGFYFDLKRYRAKFADGDTPFTPANSLIRAQAKSLQRLRSEGIEEVWRRHARVAAACRAAVGAMGLEVFAKSPADGLTVITVPRGIDGTAVLGRLESAYGIKLANGQDTLKGRIWRLAHMGYIDQFDVLAAIAGLELALGDVGHRVEPGAGPAIFQTAISDQQ